MSHIHGINSGNSNSEVTSNLGLNTIFSYNKRRKVWGGKFWESDQEEYNKQE